jgi:hypothetical protein
LHKESVCTLDWSACLFGVVGHSHKQWRWCTSWLRKHWGIVVWLVNGTLGIIWISTVSGIERWKSLLSLNHYESQNRTQNM